MNQILMSSRRTVCDGEVVTFALSFQPWQSAFGPAHRATGPFDVSASREAVIVHRAECRNPEDSSALVEAIKHAEAARVALSPYWRGGQPSMYPDEPTPCK